MVCWSIRVSLVGNDNGRFNFIRHMKNKAAVSGSIET